VSASKICSCLSTARTPPNKRCDPGQPPGSHRMCECTGLPVHRMPRRRCALQPRSHEERPFLGAVCGSGIRSDHGSQRLSPAFRGGLSEEAATPGCPETRRNASLGTLRQFTLEDRREPLAHPQSPAGVTSHACSRSTVGEPVSGCNRKMRPNCAEAVEDADSLWKAGENR